MVLIAALALGQSRHASAVADEAFRPRVIPAALMVADAEPFAVAPTPPDEAVTVATLERRVESLRARVEALERARAAPVAKQPPASRPSPPAVTYRYVVPSVPGVEAYTYAARPVVYHAGPSPAAYWAGPPAWGTVYGSTCTVDRFGRVHCR